MAIDPIRHAIMLGASIICGVLLAVFYELMGGLSYFWTLITLHCKKGTVNKFLKNFLLFFKDLFFCFVIGCVLVLVIYITNDGEFRVMAPIGMALGFIVGRKTLGHLIRYIVTLLLEMLFKALKLILRPVVFLVRKIKIKLIDRVWKHLKKRLHSHVFIGRLTNKNIGIKRKNGKDKKQNICHTKKSVDSIGANACGSDRHWNIH